MGKLSRLVHKMTIHGKTFAVHQALAIMYCTKQVIRGENFCDRLKNCKKQFQFSFMAIAIDVVNGHGLSNEIHCQLQPPKKIKVRLY